MSYGPEDLCSTDASGTLGVALENTRRGAEAIRRSGGLFGSTQLAAECEALRCWAEGEGLTGLHPCFENPPDAFGYEHQVWFPAVASESARVIKATYGGCFGHLPDGSEPGPCGYLERLLLCNHVFGDDIALEAVCEIRPGVLSVVTSQEAVSGQPAEQEMINAFFASSGFVRRRFGKYTVWHRVLDQIVASDTHGGNVLCKQSGKLVAIDVPLMLWRPSMHPLMPL